MPPTAGQPATSVDDRPHGPTSPTPPPPRPGPRKFGEGAVSGAAVMTAAKVVGAVVAFSALAILARLLPPEDYGLVAMVTSVTAFFVVFSDFGLALVTIQRPNLSREQLSTLFWLNLGFGLLLFAATVGLAPLLVWFYGDPRLFWITAATACVFPLGAVGVQHQAMLKRDMKFRRLAVARIVGTTAAAVAAVAAALLGAKWWSVVIQDVAIAGVTSAACIVAYPWRPGPPRRCEGLGGLVRFGGALTGHGMLGYFGNNMDNILIGRFCGVAELGLYSRSYALMMRPISFAGYGVGETAIPPVPRRVRPRRTARQLSPNVLALCLAWFADLRLRSLLDRRRGVDHLRTEMDRRDADASRSVHRRRRPNALGLDRVDLRRHRSARANAPVAGHVDPRRARRLPRRSSVGRIRCCLSLRHCSLGHPSTRILVLPSRNFGEPSRRNHADSPTVALCGCGRRGRTSPLRRPLVDELGRAAAAHRSRRRGRRCLCCRDGTFCALGTRVASLFASAFWENVIPHRTARVSRAAGFSPRGVAIQIRTSWPRTPSKGLTL